MKVVLINPPVNHGRYESKQSEIPPAGLGYLAAYLEGNGIQCDVVDGKVEGLSINEVVEKIAMIKPNIAGLSAMTPDVISARRVARGIKEISPGTSIVLGGAHAIAIPKETLQEFSEIDFVVTGEGEETFVELVHSIIGERNFHGIRGLGFREDEEIIINLPRDYIRDLNRLPFPAWGKFKNSSGTYFLLSARGCPYR